MSRAEEAAGAARRTLRAQQRTWKFSDAFATAVTLQLPDLLGNVLAL